MIPLPKFRVPSLWVPKSVLVGQDSGLRQESDTEVNRTEDVQKLIDLKDARIRQYRDAAGQQMKRAIKAEAELACVKKELVRYTGPADTWEG